MRQAIEDYQKKVGPVWTAESMWLEFLNKANRKEAPFDSVAGDTIYWRDHKGKTPPLTMKTLKQRLRNQKNGLKSAS